MNHRPIELSNLIDESDCMGTFSKRDPQCMNHCVLRLRCAIEKEQNLRMELIEELVASDNELGGKLQ